MEAVIVWPWLIILLVILALINYLTSRYYRLLSAIPSSEAPRFIGHIFDFVSHPNGILEIMCRIFNASTSHKEVLAIWAGPKAFVYLRDLQDIEKLLTSNSNLRKAENYDYLQPWLGDGLINSQGEIWKTHRKMITPSFHFKILEGFLEVMNRNIEILFQILDEKAGNGYFNIEPYIANYSLDIITETAMSSNIDAQRKNSKFVESIKSLTEIIIIRSVRIWFFFDSIFYLSSYGGLQKKATTYVNNFISKIMERKTREEAAENTPNELNDIGERKKLALLDLLFDVQRNNPEFSNKEILDEVNTFMFAGHDTTTSGICFLLYLLSINEDVQEKVYNEVMDNIGGKKATYQELMSLKYLERVLKESLRLYPSVPYIGRRLNEDLHLSSGHIAPKDCNVAVFIYDHHRNPKIWPDPENFDPDRFLAENIHGRHPYAYIPFSAGSRNCIGQKFATMEILLTASELVRRYRLVAEKNFTVKPISHIVLRPDEKGIRLRLERR